MKELDESWNNLKVATSEKAVRLQQAAEQRRLNLILEDEKLWLNEIETLLSSSDLGETLADVKFLLRKQQVHIYKYISIYMVMFRKFECR